MQKSWPADGKRSRIFGPARALPTWIRPKFGSGLQHVSRNRHRKHVRHWQPGGTVWYPGLSGIAAGADDPCSSTPVARPTPQLVPREFPKCHLKHSQTHFLVLVDTLLLCPRPYLGRQEVTRASAAQQAPGFVGGGRKGGGRGRSMILLRVPATIESFPVHIQGPTA